MLKLAALLLVGALTASASDVVTPNVDTGEREKEERPVESGAPSSEENGSAIQAGGAAASAGASGISEGAKDKAPSAGPRNAAPAQAAFFGPVPAGESVSRVGPSGDPTCDVLPPQRASIAPPPASAFNGGADAIDLRKVTVVKGVSIADWPITTTISNVKVGGGSICVQHDKLGKWDTAKFFDTDALVEGNQWIFAFIRGRWYGGAGEWIRPGQECKAVDAPNVGCGVFYDSEPLKSWRPAHGEIVGIAVSQPARAGQWAKAERSNVTLVKWP